MPDTTVQAPRIDRLVLPDLREVSAESLHPHTAVDAARITGDLSGGDIGGIRLVECELVDVNAHETRLQGASLSTVRIARLNAPVLRAGRTSLHDVRIEGGRIGSAEWYDADFSGVVVDGAKLGWINLRAATMRDVVFRNCVIEELDLSGAKIDRVAFENCTAGMLILTGARAKNLDLRGLDFNGLSGLEGLRGSTIGEFQASLLSSIVADHFGFRIE